MVEEKNSNYGGAREGAGRKKGQISAETKKKQTFEKLFIRSVYKEKKEIIDKIIEKAKNGDVKALTDVLNRLMGKPTEHIDHTTKGEAININIIDYKE